MTDAPAAELRLVAVVGPTGLLVIGVFFVIAGLVTEQAVTHHGPRRYVHDRVEAVLFLGARRLLQLP